MIRMARITILALVGAAALQIAVGCAGIGESAAADATPPPLTVYPHQVFSTGKSGQLGLYVEGEDWHLLVDMPGFEHLEQPFTAPTQYLYMRNESTGTLASVFAERIEGANSDESCRRHYASATQRARDWTASWVRDEGTVSEVSEIEAHGKTLRVFESTIPEFGPQKVIYWRRTIYWYPYYRGFCFDFHVTVGSTAGQEDILKVFDSVTYVAHKPVEDIDRVFYFFDWLRIRLRVPMDWQYGYLPGSPTGTGGISLRPPSGFDFSFLVTPLKKPVAAQAGEPEESLEEVRRLQEARGNTVSPVQKLCAPTTCVYYSDLADSKYDRSNPRRFPYGRIGFARIGDVVLRIDLLYRESSKDAAERITAALSRATILDLAADRKALKQGDGKAAE